MEEAHEHIGTIRVIRSFSILSHLSSWIPCKCRDGSVIRQSRSFAIVADVISSLGVKNGAFCTFVISKFVLTSQRPTGSHKGNPGMTDYTLLDDNKHAQPGVSVRPDCGFDQVRKSFK